MFKYTYNLAVQSRFVQLLKETEVVKTFYQKKRKITLRRYFGRVTFTSHFEKNHTRSFLYDKKPAITLGGVLTYLGLKEKTPEEKESELIMTIKRGILLMQQEQYDKSEVMLHLALKLAHEQNDEDAVTYVNDVLANLAFETGQHQKAEKLFVNVLQRLMAKGEEEDSNKVIHISLKLAKIFQDTKQYKKAEQGFTFCIEALDKKLEQGDEDTLALWGMSMDWYARFLLDINKKGEAFNCFKKAYEMCVKVNGETHEQSVVLLNDLGTVSSLMGDSDSALSYFEKARDIGKGLPEMKDLAAIYINLGLLYLLREMYEESKTACQEGLKKAVIFNDEAASLEARHCLENIEKVFKTSSGTKELKQLGLAGSGASVGSRRAELVRDMSRFLRATVKLSNTNAFGVQALALRKCTTTASTNPPESSAPGLSKKIVDVPSEAVGFPEASKDGVYKNPEYFCYHKASYHEAEVEMLKYRLPQPSNKAKK